MPIIGKFPSGGNLKTDKILAFVNGAHIELAATSGSNTLHLRSQTAGFDCTIHWGDGSKTIAPANGGNVLHDYAQAGVYHIFITGKSFAGFYVNNQSGKEKYVAIHSMGKWEKSTMTSLTSCFDGCSNLVSISSDIFRYNAEVTSFSYCFRACSSLTSVPADLFRYNTVVTAFNNCFEYCSSLTSVPADLFRYNISAKTFNSCFRSCSSLANIPADLFRYNVAVTNLGSCFNLCSSLANVPADLFRHNIDATNFASCFKDCINLKLIMQIFGIDYSARFVGKAMNFTNCFLRESFSGEQGAAPQLWSFTYGSVTSTGCYTGAGNSATSLSNYESIPAGWK